MKTHLAFARRVMVALLLPISLSSSQPLAQISQEDSVFLRMVQRKSFDFFWNEANAGNGLIKDRSTASSASSIASVGFGLSSICVAADYGWITRAQAADRVRTTLRTFWNGPQGYAAAGMNGRWGFFYHFLRMDTAVRDWNCELSTIDSALLLAGIVHAQEYFDGANGVEDEIRALADSIYLRADFEQMRNYGTSLSMGWIPETGWINARWVGYNEAMILYILGLGSPTHPIDADFWNAWTAGYNFGTYYGYSYVIFPPLFGHQYSHCWIDFRGIRDDKMSLYGLDYFENSRRATLAQRSYSSANPLARPAYSDSIWGITASDGPNGYAARGAPPGQNDDGTITPTAPGGSVAFTPLESIKALKTMYRQYCVGSETRLWGPYGFRDAFNIRFNWFGTDYIGIDQGPIVLMIENFFTQKVWNTFMKSRYIQTGLERAGFKKFTSVGNERPGPRSTSLGQNFPNPFNPSTTIRFDLETAGDVSLKVFDLLGRSVGTVETGWKDAGSHTVIYEARSLPTGVYYYVLQTNSTKCVKTMVVLK